MELHEESTHGWPRRATPTKSDEQSYVFGSFVGAALRGRPWLLVPGIQATRYQSLKIK